MGLPMLDNASLNMMGSYGSYFSDKILGDGPANLSFRTGKWKNVEEWRKLARKRLLECMAPIKIEKRPEVKIESITEFDGLHVEQLSWQLPYGPRTEAVFLKPAGAKGKLPGVLGLHDHAGNKFLGWRKIAQIDNNPWEVQKNHQKNYYGGRAWANELARSGYAVLVNDAFTFASRRVRVAEVPENLRGNGVDPESTDIEGINKYIAFGGVHESIMQKSLMCSGTTFAGVYATEDQCALDILATRTDVDATRLGCGGLSGGGMRTVYLSGIDERIRCAIPSGFMTTWRDFLLHKCYTHTWMIYLSLLPHDLDFPEIIALGAPAATLVLNCNEDKLFTLSEMKRADQITRELFEQCGDAEKYRCSFHPGGHKLDVAMQAEAFAWYDKHLKR
jgi:dienelactone hydrolase